MHPAGRPAPSACVRCRRKKDVAAVREATDSRRQIHGRAEVGSVALLGGTRVEPDPHGKAELVVHCPARSARWSETAAATASAALAKTETVESPSPIDWIRCPPWASIVPATRRSCQTRARAIASGCRSQSSLEPSTSVKQKVRIPVGSDIGASIPLGWWRMQLANPPRRWPNQDGRKASESRY